MSWREAAVALDMQRMHARVRLRTYLSFMLTHEEVRAHEEECHGSMSYRQDFRWNVAPYMAVRAQDL